LSPSVAVAFTHVTKTFELHRSRVGGSFQESAIAALRRSWRRGSSFTALDDVTFSLLHGKTYGFVGDNGAGKSTALKLASRIIEPTAGDVSVDGRIGALLELGAGFHPDLTGRENVFLSSAVMGLDRNHVRRRFDEIVDFAELWDFIDVPVKYYSSGMYVRLGFSVAVHMAPEILLVDEVLAVGDASFQQKCLERISRLSNGGVTIVIVSHDTGAVEALCDEVLWFDRGRLRDRGPATDVVMAYRRSVAEHRVRQLRARLAGEAPPPQDGFDAGVYEAVHNGTGRWGDGTVSITRVELRDGAGMPSGHFGTGDTLEVCIHYRTRGVVLDPVFGLAVHHQNGTQVCGPNTGMDDISVPQVSGEGVVTYSVPSLPLLEGLYLISVSAHDRTDSTTYDYHDRLYPLAVSPGDSAEKYGLVTLGGCWKWSCE